MHAIRETGFIVERELRRNFRSARGLALYALTLLGGLVSTLIGSKVNDMTTDVRGEYGTEAVQVGAAKVYEMLYRNDSIVAERLSHAPSTLVITAWASVWLCPLLVALIGFDAISAERQHRTLRYLTVRTRRGSYFVGKWLGLWATTSIVLFGVQLISWVCDLALVHDSPADVFTWGPALYAVALPILGAWSALATFMGSFVKTPMIALLLIFGSFTLCWILGNLFSGADASSPWHYIAFAYPGSFDHFLLRTGFKQILQGLGASMAFPLIFVGGGALLFKRSEV